MSRRIEPVAGAPNRDVDEAAGYARAGRVARTGELAHIGTTFTVNEDTDISSFLGEGGEDVISIFLGREDLTMDFHEVATLERFSDVLDEAALRLRARIDGHRRDAERAAG
jgi:hypothetical protein